MAIATLYDVYLTHIDNNVPVPKPPTVTEVRKTRQKVADYNKKKYCISLFEDQLCLNKQCTHWLNVIYSFHLGLHCLPKYTFRGVLS